MATSDGELIANYGEGNSRPLTSMGQFEARCDGLANMSRDLEMLEAGRLLFRVYTWDGLWVSLGRGQDPAVTLCGGVRWVRRPTGGSAVLHGHDVTVSIAMPLQRIRGLGETYRAATKPLLIALHSLGIAASLAEDAACRDGSPYQSQPDCFATTTRNDIVDPVTGAKICGCALRRTREGVLLQASIPVADPLVQPGSVIVGGVNTAVTNVDPESLASALRAALMH